MTNKQNLMEIYYHLMIMLYTFAALNNYNFLMFLMGQRYTLIYYKVKGVLPESIYSIFEQHIDRRIDRIMAYIG